MHRKDQLRHKASCSPVGALKSIVLPHGYPASVAPEYVRFQLFDTLQEAAGYFRGLLSTQAYLTGLGVGNADTTPVDAVIVTLILAYPAMLSGLAIGAVPSLVTAFGAWQKRSQVLSAVIQLLSTTLAFLAPVYPQHFLALSVGAAVIGAVSGVMGNVSRSPLIHHLARANNYGDCAAKESNQSRLLKLILILVGYRFLVWANTGGMLQSFVAFIILSTLKLVLLTQSMRVLELRTINEQRLRLLMQAWRSGSDMTPAAVSQRERIICYRGWGARFVSSEELMHAACEKLSKTSAIADAIKMAGAAGTTHLLLSSHLVLLPKDHRPRDVLVAAMHLYYHLDEQMPADDALGRAVADADSFLAVVKRLGWLVEEKLLLTVE